MVLLFMADLGWVNLSAVWTPMTNPFDAALVIAIILFTIIVVGAYAL